MKTVMLSQTECQLAELIGRKRREISLKYDRKETRQDFTPSGITNDIEASAAEMAVAKLLNIYPEWSPTVGKVPRFDLRWNGHPVDVKSTQRADGNLLIPYLDESLIYFLVCGTMPTYKVMGYLEGDRVPWAGRLREDLGHIPCWFVPASQLQEVSNAVLS